MVDESILNEVNKDERSESGNDRSLRRFVKEISEMSMIDNLQLKKKSLRPNMKSPSFEKHEELNKAWVRQNSRAQTSAKWKSSIRKGQRGWNGELLSKKEWK